MGDVAEDPLVGKTIAGKFVVESLIGSGGMSSVYRARHVALDKHVAVKVMREDLARDTAFVRRFRREAKAASRLDHPGSIHILDYGEDNGLLYMAMELLSGRDLFHTIQTDWPMPAARVVDIVSQVLAPLAVAHDLGILHRDLKPENIMIGSRTDDDGKAYDVVKVFDFGIAKMTADSLPPPSSRGHSARAATTKGIVVGTPEYMSPEQCRGETLDARSDLYSVGVILYHLLAGRLPFMADTTIDIVIKQVSEEPQPPSQIVENVPATIEAVCLRAMQKERKKRYESAREMRADLRAALDGAGALQVPRVKIGVGAGSTGMGAAETIAAMSASSAPRRTRTRAYVAGAAIAAAAALGLVVARAWTRQAPLVAQVMAQAPMTFVVPEPSSSEVLAPAPVAPVLSAKPPPRPSATAIAPRPEIVADSATAATPTTTPSPPDPAPLQSSSTTTAPALATATAAPTIAVAPFDATKGRVTWSVSGAGGGATARNVAQALARASSSWSGCYQSGLRARGRSVEGAATLRLTCDEEGRVINASMVGVDMPDVAACIRSSTIGATVSNVDTGAAWATITITFQVAK
jgi:serine/threonine-protein kinase